MTYSVISLLIETLLFAAGLYLYLFARGLIKVKNKERQQRAEELRKDSGSWMRILGLALAAIMAINIGIHLMELLG